MSSIQESEYHVLLTLLVEKSSLSIKYMLRCIPLVLQMELNDAVLFFREMTLLSLALLKVSVVAVFWADVSIICSASKHFEGVAKDLTVNKLLNQLQEKYIKVACNEKYTTMPCHGLIFTT